MDLIPNPTKREWVSCPICGEPDMRREENKDGDALILCVNHACASNGGSNADAIQATLLRRERAELDAAQAEWDGGRGV